MNLNRTDAQLIADHLGGDEGAIAVLIGRHLRPVHDFICRLTGDRAEAEDIAQETFIKMWRSLGHYRADRNFRTWLYTIARRTAIDHWRRKRAVPFADFEDESGDNVLADTLADAGPLPDELAVGAEQAEAAARAVARLPGRYQVVITLRHADDLTFEEIGQVLGKPLNTVKSHYRRALAALRRIAADSSPGADQSRGV